MFGQAFEFIQQNPDQLTILQNEYVTFSENLLKFIKDKGTTEQHYNDSFFVSDILDKQKEINFGEDYKIEELTQTSNQGGVEESKSAPVEVQAEMATSTQQLSSKPKAIFIIPFATPSSGKSYVWSTIKDLIESNSIQFPKVHFEWSWSFISSDDIRDKIMKEILDQNPEMSKQDAFDKSAKRARNDYRADMIELIKDTKSLKPNQIRVIYLDKNHPPNGGIESVTKMIDDLMPQSVEYTKLYLVPEIKNPQLNNFPFSFQFLYQVLFNAYHRKDH